MLKLNNKPLSYERAFTHADIPYPATVLRLSSLDERNALGITEVADAPSYDQRCYWGVDNPKDLAGLKTQWSDTQTAIASALLAPSDWRVIKAKETGTNIPSTWKTYRAAIRTACNTRQTEINAVADVPAIKELFFGEATITRQQTDSEGAGVAEEDHKPVMETVDNTDGATDGPTTNKV